MGVLHIFSKGNMTWQEIMSVFIVSVRWGAVLNNESSSENSRDIIE
jgi:hypothetical protein